MENQVDKLNGVEKLTDEELLEIEADLLGMNLEELKEYENAMARKKLTIEVSTKTACFFIPHKPISDQKTQADQIKKWMGRVPNLDEQMRYEEE